MGEYIKRGNEEYKIGTCENLYYTTYEELKRLDALSSVSAYEYLKIDSGFRFRFPFPDENHTQQFGKYEDFERGVLISIPKSLGVEIAHGTSFYRTDEKVKIAPAVGFRFPCVMANDFPFKKFDWSDTERQTIFEVIQQKYVTDKDTEKPSIHVVVRCPYCGSACRLSREEMIAITNYMAENWEQYSELQKEVINIAWQGYEISNDQQQTL